MNRNHIAILIIISLFSCQEDKLNKDTPILPGNILYRSIDWARMNDLGSCCYSEYHLYSKGNDRKISINPDGSETIGILKWLNNEFALIGLKNSKSIIKIDTSGRILSNIFDVNDSFKIWNMSPSPNDKYILILKQKRINNTFNPCAHEHAPFVISILDTISKIEKTLLRFSYEEFVKLSDSPWSPDNNQFVFTYSQNSRCIILDPKMKTIPEPKNTFRIDGVYKYDLQKGLTELIIESGDDAIWSNSGKHIGFVIKEDVRVLDLYNNEIIVIRPARSYETIQTLHWLPNKDILYSRHYFSFIKLDIITMFTKTRHSAYDINKQEQTNYQFIDFGFDYTWK